MSQGQPEVSPRSPHHMGKVKVEGSVLEVLPSPGQEAVSFDLREYDVPILDAWPWTTNAILLSGLAIGVGIAAVLVRSPWAWVGGFLLGAILIRSAVVNLRPTPVIRLFRDGAASEVRLDPIGEADFTRLSGDLSLVQGALGFASSRLPGVPEGTPLGGLVYVLTHDRLSQSLEVMKLCYRQAVTQIRAGEFPTCRSIHFVVNGSLPRSSEKSDSFQAALAECEGWSETTGPRIRADYSWAGEPQGSRPANVEG